MPPRRRTGGKPGQLSDEMRAAVAAEAERLAAIEDPVEAIKAVAQAFADLDSAVSELAVPRLRAVAELRAQGWSYDAIAVATGLSKPRVAQLAREAKRRRL